MKLFVTALLITTGFAFILGDTPDELERKRLLIQQYTKLYEDCLTESKCFDKPGLLCFAKCNDRAKDNLGIPRDPENNPENNISEEDELNEFEESNDTTTDPNIDQEQNYETNDETVTDPNINQEQNYETIDETVTDPNINQEECSETIVETITDPNISQEQYSETIVETITDPNINQEQNTETIVETVVPNDNQQT